MRIAVVGAGAVGGLVAWHLARAKMQPVVVARGETAAALRRDGLTLQTPSQTARVDIEVIEEISRIEPFDTIFVGLKAQDWPAALPLLSSLIDARTAVVALLNGIPWWYRPGLDAVDLGGAIARSIPLANVVGGVVYTGVTRQGPAHLVWNGRKRFILGEPSGGRSARVLDLVALLNGAGLDAEASDDIRSEVWLKLLGNTTYNPLSVITGATIGRMGSDPALNRIVRLIMEETVAVARAVGITTPIDIETRLRVAPQMVDFKTSMLQDFEAGKALELGAIVDAVVELGRRTGVPTPTIETIGALAADRARQRR